MHNAPKVLTAATSATVTSAPLVQPAHADVLKPDACEMKRNESTATFYYDATAIFKMRAVGSTTPYV